MSILICNKRFVERQFSNVASSKFECGQNQPHRCASPGNPWDEGRDGACVARHRTAQETQKSGWYLDGFDGLLLYNAPFLQTTII